MTVKRASLDVFGRTPYGVNNQNNDDVSRVMASTAKKPSKSKASVKAIARKPAVKKSARSKVAPDKAPTSKVTAPAPTAKTVTPTVVNKPQPVVLGPEMRKKELIDTVVTRSGIKKKDAKPVVEAMLAVLGDALAEGRELILPPLGKVIVRKEKALPRGKMMMVKIRQTTAPTPQEIETADESGT